MSKKSERRTSIGMGCYWTLACEVWILTLTGILDKNMQEQNMAANMVFYSQKNMVDGENHRKKMQITHQKQNFFLSATGPYPSTSQRPSPASEHRPL